MLLPHVFSPKHNMMDDLPKIDFLENIVTSQHPYKPNQTSPIMLHISRKLNQSRLPQHNSIRNSMLESTPNQTLQTEHVTDNQGNVFNQHLSCT